MDKTLTHFHVLSLHHTQYMTGLYLKDAVLPVIEIKDNLSCKQAA